MTKVPAACGSGHGRQGVANPLRNVAFRAATLRTSLYSSVMAFEVAGLAIPSWSRKLHVEPVAA